MLQRPQISIILRDHSASLSHHHDLYLISHPNLDTCQVLIPFSTILGKHGLSPLRPVISDGRTANRSKRVSSLSAFCPQIFMIGKLLYLLLWRCTNNPCYTPEVLQDVVNAKL